jgi:glycosyltransferase involved in cell wall biosynthesis
VLFDVNRLEAPASPQSNGHISVANGDGHVSDVLLAARRKVLGGNWLFVGRIAPHKRQHRLVQTLAAYKKLFGEEARLDLVGRPGSLRYTEAVRRCAEELGVADSVHVSGEVDNAELGAYYRNADVFVSASIHEGFGVPIVESMHNGVPIVALTGAALPETLNGAGLLVEHDDPALLAAAVHEVGSNGDLRGHLIEAGTVRAGELGLARSRETMRKVLERWIEGRGHFEPIEPVEPEPIPELAGSVV